MRQKTQELKLQTSQQVMKDMVQKRRWYYYLLPWEKKSTFIQLQRRFLIP